MRAKQWENSCFLKRNDYFLYLVTNFQFLPSKSIKCLYVYGAIQVKQFFEELKSKVSKGITINTLFIL